MIALGPLFGFEVQHFLPYAVGCGVAIGLTSMVWLIARRPRETEQLPAPPPPPKINCELPPDDEDIYANRRTSNRRDGIPVQVVISSPSLPDQLDTGWVLDRSTGGLRIAVSQTLPVGSNIQVRAENAPNTIPWVMLTIRSCRKESGHYEIGCSFEETPPWNVLLLFG